MSTMKVTVDSGNYEGKQVNYVAIYINKCDWARENGPSGHIKFHHIFNCIAS